MHLHADLPRAGRALFIPLLVPLLVSLLGARAEAAPYVWLTSEAGAAQAHVGELLPDPKAGALPALAEPRALLADGKELAVHAEADGYAIALPGDAARQPSPSDLRFTAKSLGSDGVLTLFDARAGRTETKAVNDLELVPTEPGGATFRLFWKGSPVAATEVNVQTSAGWRRTLRAGADGTISLVSAEYPALFRSRYVLEVTARINGKVTLAGKTYDEVRHTATLSFDVP